MVTVEGFLCPQNDDAKKERFTSGLEPVQILYTRIVSNVSVQVWFLISPRTYDFNVCINLYNFDDDDAKSALDLRSVCVYVCVCHGDGVYLCFCICVCLIYPIEAWPVRNWLDWKSPNGDFTTRRMALRRLQYQTVFTNLKNSQGPSQYGFGVCF